MPQCGQKSIVGSFNATGRSQPGQTLLSSRDSAAVIAQHVAAHLVGLRLYQPLFGEIAVEREDCIAANQPGNDDAGDEADIAAIAG